MALTLASIRAFWLVELPNLPFVLVSCSLIALVVRHLHRERRPRRLRQHEDDSWSLDGGSKPFRAARLIDAGQRSAHRIELVLLGTLADGRLHRHRLTVASDSVSAVDFSFLHLQRALRSDAP